MLKCTYACVHGGIIVIILVAASKHHVEHGTKYVLVFRPPSCWDLPERRQMKILHPDDGETKLRLSDDQFTH